MVKKWSNLVTFLHWNNGKMDDMYAFINFLIQTEIKRNCQKLHIIIQFSNFGRNTSGIFLFFM